MKDSSKTKAQLINEIIEMRKQIAEQEKSEFESKRVEKALRESKEHYHTLFNLSPSGIILTDSKGIILMVNNSFCKYNGYTPDELKGNNIKILVPDDKHNNVNLTQ
jgi:PAS domain-containing protein